MRRDLLASRGELGSKSLALLTVRLLTRRLRGLARQVPIEPQKRLLKELPVALVVGPDHPEKRHGHHDADREKDAVQPRDVVVVIDRLGRRLAGHWKDSLNVKRKR